MDSVIIGITPEYVEIIRQVFEERKSKNASYSLRAFANSLGIDASSLSAILSNKRSLPLNRANDFILKLKLCEQRSAKFMQSLLGRATSAIRNHSYSEGHEIDDEKYYSVIAEWEYFAVLSLINLKDFEPKSEWISKRLGIEESRAHEVLSRLVQLELLEAKDGRYAARYGRIKTSEDISSAALKMAHLEELDFIKERALNLPVNERHISSLTISIKKQNLEKAFSLIRSFRTQMESDLETEVDADEVYQLAIQFYPLTR